jgi:simple sugar transport system permease protein
MVALAFLTAVISISVPYVLGAVGGTLSERSGVVNIALEGLLLGGAFAATVGADWSGSAAFGVLAGGAAGGALAALYAALVVWLRTGPIITGVALNLLVDAVTRFLLKIHYGSASNSPKITAWPAGQSDLFHTLSHPMVLGTIALVLLCHFGLARTRFGLRIRAVGEHPEAALSLGVSPSRVRFLAVLACGVMVGLGGVWLAWDQRLFRAQMSNGRGYIALAALIFGGWRPLPAAGAGLLFGAAEALQITLAAHAEGGGGMSGATVQMLPYLVTLAVLLVGGQRRRAPAALSE